MIVHVHKTHAIEKFCYTGPPVNRDRYLLSHLVKSEIGAIEMNWNIATYMGQGQSRSILISIENGTCEAYTTLPEVWNRSGYLCINDDALYSPKDDECEDNIVDAILTKIYCLEEGEAQPQVTCTEAKHSVQPTYFVKQDFGDATHVLLLILVLMWCLSKLWLVVSRLDQIVFFAFLTF